MNDPLRPLPHDDRDLQVGAFFLLPKLAELPESFELEGYDIKQQLGTDFCSAFASTGMSELQEGVKLSPEYSFAMGKSLSGDPEAWGQDLRGACKPHVKIGDIEQSDTPFSVENKDRDFLVNSNSWDIALKIKAAKHQKKTYIKVSGVGDDSFDTIRKTIWKWRDEKRAVLIGVQWSWAFDKVILDTIGPGSGHAMYCIGWKTIGNDIYLVIVNSWGKEAGDNGIHLMARNVINYFEPIYGAFMFVDMPREDLQFYVNNKIKEGDNMLLSSPRLILTILWKFVSSIWLTPNEKIEVLREISKTVDFIANNLKIK